MSCWTDESRGGWKSHGFTGYGICYETNAFIFIGCIVGTCNEYECKCMYVKKVCNKYDEGYGMNVIHESCRSRTKFKIRKKKKKKIGPKMVVR